MSAQDRPDSLGRWLIVLGSVVAALAVMAAILVGGTPSERRALRMDERRVSDLARLSREIDQYWEREKRLPDTLQVLAGKPGLRLATTDPVTDAPYEYSTTGGRGYRLCAVFATDSADRRSRVESKWAHGVGRHCFQDSASDE